MTERCGKGWVICGGGTEDGSGSGGAASGSTVMARVARRNSGEGLDGVELGGGVGSEIWGS